MVLFYSRYLFIRSKGVVAQERKIGYDRKNLTFSCTAGVKYPLQLS